MFIAGFGFVKGKDISHMVWLLPLIILTKWTNMSGTPLKIVIPAQAGSHKYLEVLTPAGAGVTKTELFEVPSSQ